MCCSVKVLVRGSLVVLAISVALGVYLNYSNDQLTKAIIEWGEAHRIPLDKDKIKLSPFKVEYNEQEWNFLVKKLEMSRYFKPLSEKYVARNEFGFDPEYAKELVDYWKTKFNWKTQVDYLNKYPQFKITLNETIVHYVRVITNKNSAKSPCIPVMLVDGWPGSSFSFYKVIDYISEHYKDQSFDIIVPSIPGYGYSSPLDRPFDVTDTALLFDALMRFTHGENVKYFVHGEDWGAIMSSVMAQLFPQTVSGIHLTMPIADETSDILGLLYTSISLVMPSVLYSPNEIRLNLPQRFSIKSRFGVILREMGYMHLQATTPDTVAQGLTDSPVGLLAYILEKYYAWSFDFETQIAGKKGANLDSFDRDELLTIITVYWMTNTISSSVRYYKCYFELFKKEWPLSKIARAKVPDTVAVAVHTFMHELVLVPEKIVKLRYPGLTQYNIGEDGGHFAAFQNPKLTATDFIGFVNKVIGNGQ